MTTHPNRGWRSRWTVDRAKQEARHGPSGLVVKFQPHPDGGWTGESPNMQEVFAALQKSGTQHLDRVLARLLREAGDIYAESHHE